MNKAVKFLVSGFNQLIWPALCQSCSVRISEAERGLCDDCWNTLLGATASHHCPRCGRSTSAYSIVNNRCPECINEQIHFDGIVRSGTYTESLRQLILKFKSGSTHLQKQLAMLINPTIEGAGFKNDIDFFVPVPLHWRKRLKRGYNQSKILAVSLEHPAAVNTDLVRIKHTDPQFSLNPSKRKRNVAGAFALRKDHKLAGKRICLVDDIKTTGATLNECARILKEGGAAKVYAVVAAVAGSQKK